MTQRAKYHCHKLVAETAKAMALAVYEEQCSQSNEFYAQHPTSARFVAFLLPKLLEQARATLAGMLGRPGDEALKEQIADALINDESLRKSRGKYRAFH